MCGDITYLVPGCERGRRGKARPQTRAGVGREKGRGWSLEGGEDSRTRRRERKGDSWTKSGDEGRPNHGRGGKRSLGGSLGAPLTRRWGSRGQPQRRG